MGMVFAADVLTCGKARAQPMGTEEDMQNKPHGVPGSQAAFTPSRYFQGSPVASDDCLALACQAPGECPAKTLLLSQVSWHGLHCSQPPGPCSPLRLRSSFQSHGGFRIGTYPDPALHIPFSRVSRLHLMWRGACGHWRKLFLPPHQSLTPEVSGPTCGA